MISQVNGTCETVTYPIRSVVMSGFLLLPICIFGLIGNFLCVTLLIRKYFATSVFRIYLSALCLADCGTLLAALFMLALPILAEFFNSNPLWQSLMSRSILMCYPFGVMAEGTSTLATATISIVRFLSLKCPLSTRALSRAKVAKVIVVSVCLFTFLLNIPRFLELKLFTCNSITGNYSISVVGTTVLRDSALYQRFYMVVVYTALMYILPFAAIIVCNASICYILIKTWSSRLQLHRHGGASKSNELTATRLIVFLCLLFVVSHTLPFILNAIEASLWEVNITEAYSATVDVSNFLVALKASSNFLWYLMFNENFRSNLSENFSMNSRTLAHSSSTHSQMDHFGLTKRLNDTEENVLMTDNEV